MYPDIYFDPKFGKLYEGIENGKFLHLKVSNQYGTIENNVLVREIDTLINKNKYYDLITPYGYGGPYIKKQSGDREKLIKSYINYMNDFTTKNNIVSEFARFHPIYKNANDFEKEYNTKNIRNTVITTIHNEDTFTKEFSKSTRKTVRKIFREYDINFKVTKAPKTIDSFMEVYYSTMNRVNAEEFYFFDRKYFESLIQLFQENILLIEIKLEDKVVASGLYLVYNGIMHAHLSGTLNDYMYLSPAYITKYAAVNWGEKNSMKFLFHGGGTSNDKDNGLYKFKKKFSKTEDLDFYIGKKIWNNDVYQKLCVMTGNQDGDFFPLYRQ